jgi:hypothetical protein
VGSLDFPRLLPGPRLAGEVTAARNQVAALAPNSAAVRQLDTALAGHNLA